MRSLPAGAIIASAVFFFAVVVLIEILNIGGVRGYLSPGHDRRLKRLPTLLRLVWFLLLLLLGAIFVAMMVSPSGFLAFLEAPLGQIFGALFWVGLILVFVTGFTRRKQ